MAQEVTVSYNPADCLYTWNRADGASGQAEQYAFAWLEAHLDLLDRMTRHSFGTDDTAVLFARDYVLDRVIEKLAQGKLDARLSTGFFVTMFGRMLLDARRRLQYRAKMTSSLEYFTRPKAAGGEEDMRHAALRTTDDTSRLELADLFADPTDRAIVLLLAEGYGQQDVSAITQLRPAALKTRLQTSIRPVLADAYGLAA